ncbi:MFS transporter [Kitasatospora sp. YST-16]|uniref:MFS transporter n=1 Tax=Kitasatospora sp. YST-16 TaxID=2998080 RepID=UPI0022852101|nr:MFS transporter [Kitasatospora sp. YST-16]WAL74844.1 MFS transporter [Kitasatospora sp. YST-16]WNW40900.1 MFS transporter [Streptomyces sp. Li-HN-5-13]
MSDVSDLTERTDKTVPAPEALRPLRYAGVFALLFLFGTETFLVSPLLPTIAESIGSTEAAAASTVTAYVLVYAVFAPFLGLLSDRFGRRRTLLAGGLLFVLSNAAAALSTDLTLLVLSRALAGLAAAAAGPAIWAHIAETAPEAVRGRALGLGMALFSTGQVVGVPLGGVLAGAAGWRAAFWALAIGTFAAIALLTRQVAPAQGSAAAGGAVRAILAGWRDPVLRRALLVNTVFNAANLGAYTFLGAVLDRRFDLSVQALGLVGVLVGAGSVAGSLIGGRLGDKARGAGRTDLPLLALWGLLLAAGIALATSAPGLPLSLLGVLVWFTASGAFVTDQQTLAGSVAPAHRATSSAWLTSTMYAGTGLGAWAVGAFSDVTHGALLIGTGLALAAAAGAWLVSRGLKQNAEQQNA